MNYDLATVTEKAISSPVVGPLLQKINLVGLSLGELEAKVMALGLPKFRAKQVWRWIWRHGLTNFDEMSDLSKPVRELLGVKFSADRPAVSKRLQSVDGTIKWLMRFPDGNEAECVYIPNNCE